MKQRPIIVILPKHQNVEIGGGTRIRTVRLRPGEFVLISETNAKKTFLVKCTRRCAECCKGHFYINPDTQLIKVKCVDC